MEYLCLVSNNLFSLVVEIVISFSFINVSSGGAVEISPISSQQVNINFHNSNLNPSINKVMKPAKINLN